jgi:peptide/nickel transport system substrate-binding protein
MKKSAVILLSLLMILSLALAGCGSGSTGAGEKKGTETKQPETKQPEAKKEEPKKAAEPTTLIFGRGGDSVALDPAAVTDGESIKVTKQIFDTLLDYEDGGTKVIPALAELPEVSADGLVYTFKLKQGVKFHDGTDFNADAVVYNFNRWMNANDTQKGQFEYYSAMFGGFKGDEGHVIQEVKSVDTHTVQFTLKRPQGPFLQNIAMPPFSIASPAALEKYGDKFLENPVGTGPFIFKEWKRNDTITLEKNPDYWMKGFPLVDRLIYRSIPDNSARFTALQNGEVDIMDGLNPQDVSSVKSNNQLQLILRPSMNVGYLGFNVEMKPLNKKEVRVALSHAVNKEGLIQAFYNGQAIPAKNPMPPSIWGHNDSIQDYPYDLDKAKKLLADAGYPNGFEIELWAMPVPRPYMPDGMKIAEALKADFDKIGVKTKIITMDWAQYLDETKNGKQGMFLLGWTGDNGDPDNFIYVLLDQDNAGGSNRARYKNQQLHDLLIEAQSLTDIKERTQLYEQAQVIIHEEAPWVPLVHSTPALAASAKVKGFVPSPTGSDKMTGVSVK